MIEEKFRKDVMAKRKYLFKKHNYERKSFNG